MSKAKTLLVLIMLLGLVGCKSTLTSLMRADPVPLTDFVPHHEKLRRMDASCPFHYHWCDLDALIAANPKHVYIAPVEMGYLQKGNAWDELAKSITTSVNAAKIKPFYDTCKTKPRKAIRRSQKGKSH